MRSALAASSQSECFRVVEYSVQSNHVHLLVEVNPRASSRAE